MSFLEIKTNVFASLAKREISYRRTFQDEVHSLLIFSAAHNLTLAQKELHFREAFALFSALKISFAPAQSDKRATSEHLLKEKRAVTCLLILSDTKNEPGESIPEVLYRTTAVDRCMHCVSLAFLPASLR